MTPQEVKDYYKSGYRFHLLTGMSHRTLGNWLAWGYVPVQSQMKLHELTNGELRFSIKDSNWKGPND